MKVYDVASPLPPKFPSPVLLLTAITTVLNGGFHFGFQISIVNPMATIFQEFLVEGLSSKYNIEINEQLASLLWSFVASSVLIGALFGAIFVIGLVERKGPLQALYQASIVQLTSLFLLSISGFVLSPILFIVSRLSSGFAVGMSATAQGVFLAEISPDEHRGKIGTFGGFSTNIGFILAATLGLPYTLGTKKYWPFIFLIEAFPCMLLILSSCIWIKESPVHYIRNKQFDKAKEAISCYYGNEKAVEAEFSRISKEFQNLRNEKTTFLEIFQNKLARKALFISLAVNVAVSFSGITAVSFFGTALLRNMGFNENAAATANLLCSFAGTAGALLATVTTDKIGSRVLILSGLLFLVTLDSLMMLFVYIFSITQQMMLGWVFLLLFVLFLFAFSAGIGPAAWSIGAELASDSFRSKIQSAAVSTQYLACFLSPIIYYPMSTTIGPLSFLVFIVPLAMSAFYLFCNLSCGKTLQVDCEKMDANGNDVSN